MPSEGKLMKKIYEIRTKFPDIDTEEIKDIYLKFKKQAKGRNKLKRKDFEAVYKQAFGERAAPLADLIFNAFDMNNDGKVVFEEFLIGMRIADSYSEDRGDKLDTLRWAFNVYDANRDGTIDRQEMRSLVKGCVKVSAIEKAVSDLSAAEIPDIARRTPDEYADDLFADVDANQDGRITFQEFCQAAGTSDVLVALTMPAPSD